MMSLAASPTEVRSVGPQRRPEPAKPLWYWLCPATAGFPVHLLALQLRTFFGAATRRQEGGAR